MPSIRGTRTAENLLKAFAGESQARNRYQFYAKAAKEEGYVKIYEVFMETALNEKSHARRFFGYLSEEYKGEEIIIGAGYPVGLGTTAENLEYAAEGEHDEWSNLYPAFADTAEEEGFAEIAACFRYVAKAEIHHEQRFLELKQLVETGKVFEKDEEIEWICEHCGYIHKGKSAPKVCPTCRYPQAYFAVFCEKF